MPMSPHPTFDFSKVVDTHVTHNLYDHKTVVGVAWVQGQIADAEAHASASAYDSVSQNSHGHICGRLTTPRLTRSLFRRPTVPMPIG